MKVSREQAAENRERIVNVAAKLFRERGFDGIGVADIMNAAIDVLRNEGATVELIPALAPQLGTCVAHPTPAPPPGQLRCSSVLLYGFKRDLKA